jgi:hypothetical protein
VVRIAAEERSASEQRGGDPSPWKKPVDAFAELPDGADGFGAEDGRKLGR